MQTHQTFSKRFWAHLLDGFILVIPTMPFYFLAVMSPVSKPLRIIFIVFCLLAFHIYTILMHGLYGQTLGKMATKIKVLSLDESLITMSQSLLRDGVPLLISIGLIFNFVYMILDDLPIENPSATAIGYSFTFISYMWYIADIGTFLLKRRTRAAHDLIAGTIVVRLD